MLMKGGHYPGSNGQGKTPVADPQGGGGDFGHDGGTVAAATVRHLVQFNGALALDTVVVVVRGAVHGRCNGGPLVWEEECVKSVCE